MRRLFPLAAALVLIAGVAAAPRHLASRVAGNPDFVHFESGHVRPLALTSHGRLLVVNTADNRLSVFDVTGPAPARIAEIPVGLEPVSVAVRNDGEAWVVNQLSDDVSVVDLTTLHVRATLRVGDEPSDVVFAGAPPRAYVSVSNEDRVRVYDPANLALPPVNVPIPGRMPRALAASPLGDRVYVAVFHSGNRTSVLSEADVPDDSLPSDPQFPRNPALGPRPRTGLMVKQEPGGTWRDMYGKSWSHKIPYSIREVDVAEIATASNSVTRTFGDIGAVNFGLAVSPGDGRIALTATEARNHLRLEPRLEGHVVDTRIGFITPAGAVTVRDLNPHVDYTTLPGTQAERDSALGIPTGVAFSGDGSRAFVTSLASDRLGVLDVASAGVAARVATVAGPTGVLVDEPRGRVYVVGRFRNQLQTLSSATLGTVAIAPIGFDPTPDVIVNGRKFFYGGFTSAHGDQSCASCHVFGDFDNLAWDLGDPAGSFQPPPPGMIDPALEGFDPEKGPMTTQSLRGLPSTGVLHWRGDRTDLDAFNSAFMSLLGRTSQLPDSEMAAFDEFVLPLAYPPNPAQHLDRTMPDAPAGQPSARRGQSFFMNQPTDGGVLTCNQCHTIPTGTNGQIVNDAALQEDQDIKVPQLRNMYKKTGFTDAPGAQNKRGFGFIHDGSVDNLFNFLQFPGFNFGPPATANATRRDVEAFLLAFDTGMAPAVGHQITFDGSNSSHPTLVARLDTLKTQDGASCDLIAKGRVGGQPRGWRYQGADLWRSDKSAEASITTAALRALAGPGAEVTITGVPEGSGERMGLDRDRDTYYDGDERDAGSDPGNPLSTPLNVGVVAGGGAAGFALHAIAPNPFRAHAEVRFALGRPGPVDLTVHDVLGREVRAVARGVRLVAGPQTLRWDGRRSDGRPAAAGVYFLRLKTEAATWTRPAIRLP